MSGVELLLLLDRVGAGASSPPIYRATYTATNGTPLQDYTPEVGGQFSIDTSTFDIQSNKANVATYSFPAVAWIDPGVSDYKIEGVVNNVVATTPVGFVVRRLASNNFHMVRITSGALSVYSYTGSLVLRTQATVTDFAQDKRLVVWVRDNHIMAIWDDRIGVSWMESPVSNGGQGFGIYAEGASRRWDDVLVTTPTPTQTNKSTFTATTGTNITAYSPEVGPSWNVPAWGVWEIDTNKLLLKTATGSPGSQYGVNVDTGLDDLKASVETIAPAGVNCGIRFRMVSETLFFLADTSDNVLTLWEYNSGFANRGSTGIVYGDNRKLEVIAIKNFASICYHNTWKVNYNNVLLATGGRKAGLHGGAANVKCDNFLVTNR
jgi:hypothetical protein